MKTKTTLILILGLTLITGTAAWSKSYRDGFMEPGGPGKHRQHSPEKMLLMLDLGDEQKSQVARIVARYRKLERDLKEDNRGMHREMAAIMFAETFDEAKARETFRKNSAVREELMVLKGKMLAEMRALLNEEQIEALKAMRAKAMRMHAARAEFKALVDDAMAGEE
jgi:Spy/CpxP family protein refolding chaperone